MNKFQDIFGCRYPVMALAMNRVSDVKLAVAVTEAGGIGSLSLFNYFVQRGKMNWDAVESALTDFQAQTGHLRVVMSLDISFFNEGVDSYIVKLIERFKVPFVEIIFTKDYRSNRKFYDRIFAHLQSIGCKLIIKAVLYKEVLLEGIYQDFDAIGIKGPDGAGRVSDNDATLEERIIAARAKFPDKILISAGGVGNADQVKKLLSIGADGIGAGTLFAASTESRIAYEAKLKLVGATTSQLSQIGTDDLNQNALVFSKIDRDTGDNNNTRSLYIGMTSGNSGHIFAGKAIDDITEILPVKDIVNRLFPN